MKVVTKLMLLALVLATFALPMLVSGPNGRPLMTPGDWIPKVSLADKLPLGGSTVILTPAKDSLREQTQHNNTLIHKPQPRPLQQSASMGQMYKWQDKQGRWNFSNEKPVDFTDATVEDLPVIKNVMEPAVNRGQNSSTISLPDLGNAGALLERLQRSAAGSEQ